LPDKQAQRNKEQAMAVVDQASVSRVAIADAIGRELQRQGIEQADVEALADAVEGALVPHAPPSEGKRPEDLNATNDD
jgi:predicted transcriptional regulator